MECERDVLVSPTTEVPVIEGQVVTAIRTLASRGGGKKAIAREVGVAVNTMRRYLRQPITPGQQVRPAARRLTDDHRAQARTLYEGPGRRQCGGRAAAARRGRLLMSVRTIERAVADMRRAQRVAALGDRPNGNRAGRPAADRFWPEAEVDCRGQRPDLAAGRGSQLFAPPLASDTSQSLRFEDPISHEARHLGSVLHSYEIGVADDHQERRTEGTSRSRSCWAFGHLPERRGASGSGSLRAPTRLGTGCGAGRSPARCW
jgi:hypothetical protein